MPATPSEDARKARPALSPEDEAAGRPLPDGVAALTSAAERRDFFRRFPELARGSLVDALCAEATALLGVDLDHAKRLAETASWLAEALDDAPSRARSDRAAANVLHLSGDSEQAQAIYGMALVRFLELGEDGEAAITRSSALLNLGFLGDYATAYEWYVAAREVFERLGDRRRLAVLEHNFGLILGRQDRWDKALESYQVALEEFDKLGQAQDVAFCLCNVAVCHINLHRFDDALAVHKRNRAYCQRHGLTRILLQVDYNIAYLYFLRGEYMRAIQLYRTVRRDCDAAGDDYHMALCDLDQAEMFLDLNLVKDAARLARRAQTALERLRMPYESAKALAHRAIAESRRGRSAEALRLLLDARVIFSGEKNLLWPPLIDFYRAVILLQEHRPKDVEILTRDALKIFADSGVAPKAALCEVLLAELMLERDRPEEARQACRAALDRLAGLELPALEYRVHLVLGRAEEAIGDGVAALAAYRRSHRWLESLWSRLQEEGLKIAFLKDKLVVYEDLVWLTLRGSASAATETDRRAAFGYIESAKSRALADLLAFRAHALKPRSAGVEGRGPKRTETGAQLAESVSSLREELSSLYRQVDRETMRGGERALASSRKLQPIIRRREDQLLRALRDLRTTDHELASLQTGAVVDLETVRSSLPPEAVLVEYFIARGTILACVVDRHRLEIVTLAAAARARELHRFLQFQLSRLVPGVPHSASRELIENVTLAHLKELYDQLIRPIRDHLDRPELILVPHGFLHYVPFHALHDGDAYLIDEFTISYAPSAGVFHLCAAKEAAAGGGALVLGVADERAPRILDEARAVAESLPGATLLTGEQASEEALKRHGAESRFLHVATHGLFRRDNPMFSAIQLGTSRLSLFDLYDLRLAADMVVLSGCGTGLNAVMGSDELVGLTRGWLYAGARSVVVSLWDVHDASTAAFMRRFYGCLGDGRQRAQALRRTMRDVREEYPHPYHWAPFVLVGKPADATESR